jgi:ABC-type transporter Mla MlaB component
MVRNSSIIQLTEETFEDALNIFGRSSAIDLQDISFIDPYGMVGILEIGEQAQLEGVTKTLYLPAAEEVLKYLERMDFFMFADRYFTLEPSKPHLSENI